MPKGSFAKWKQEKESEEHIDKGLSQDGALVENNPSMERLQESDDPAAEVDVENAEWFQDLIEYRRKDKRNTSIFVLGATPNLWFSLYQRRLDSAKHEDGRRYSQTAMYFLYTHDS